MRPCRCRQAGRGSVQRPHPSGSRRWSRGSGPGGRLCTPCCRARTAVGNFDDNEQTAQGCMEAGGCAPCTGLSPFIGWNVERIRRPCVPHRTPLARRPVSMQTQPWPQRLPAKAQCLAHGGGAPNGLGVGQQHLEGALADSGVHVVALPGWRGQKLARFGMIFYATEPTWQTDKAEEPEVESGQITLKAAGNRAYANLQSKRGKRRDSAPVCESFPQHPARAPASPGGRLCARQRPGFWCR